MGGVYYKDFSETQQVLIGTISGFQQYTGAGWVDVTGTTLTGNADQQVRFTVFPFSNSTRLIAVNDKDVPQSWLGTGTFAALGGNPPVAKCAAVAFQRVVLGNVTVGGTRRSSALWISGFQDPTDWSAVREVNLTDTKDSIVEVRALNAQSFAIYKENSQWVGLGAGGIFPFIFELRDQQAGPVSPASVVQAEKQQYYVGLDGDIYQFDGNACQPIGGTVKRLIQSGIDWTNARRTHGFYDQLNREIWWFWPSGDEAGVTGGVVYRLPYGDVPGAFSPLMRYGREISASFNWLDLSRTTWDELTGTWDSISTPYPTWDSFQRVGRPGDLIGDNTGQVYRFGTAAGDAGATFDAEFDFPFRPVAGPGELILVDTVESYFKQASSFYNVSIILLTNNTMATVGTPELTQVVDISQDIKHRVTFYNVLSRFISLRHRMSNTLGLQEYRGGVGWFWKRSEG